MNGSSKVSKMIKTSTARKAATAALLLGASAGLAGCVGGVASNRTLYSQHQPVVSRTNYVFDVMTSASGIPIGEQSRLAGWWEAMDISYGDKVSVDTTNIGPAARADLMALADRQGIILAESAPVTEGQAGPGVARVVGTEDAASVGADRLAQASDALTAAVGDGSFLTNLQASDAAFSAVVVDVAATQTAIADAVLEVIVTTPEPTASPTPRPTVAPTSVPTATPGSDTVDAAYRLSGVSAALLVLALAA